MYMSYALVLLTVLVVVGVAVLVAAAVTAVLERRAAPQLAAIRCVAPQAPPQLERAA